MSNIRCYRIDFPASSTFCYILKEGDDVDAVQLDKNFKGWNVSYDIISAFFEEEQYKVSKLEILLITGKTPEQWMSRIKVIRDTQRRYWRFDKE